MPIPHEDWIDNTTPGEFVISLDFILKWKALRRTVNGIPHEKVEAVIDALLNDHQEFLIDPSSLH